jgi:divalent metal cation (Fe/Co/Zn/Cd) transporter
MSVEVLVSAVVAARAHSIAMLAFGGDSAIELASALIVLFRFSDTGLTERRAARITAFLLFALAAFIICASVLSLTKVLSPPKPTYLGIGLLVAAAVVMPLLAKRKRQLSVQTGSSALAADAAQSSICAWLAWIALAGLALNGVLGIGWADPLAALAIIPIVLNEARHAWNERACHCC